MNTEKKTQKELLSNLLSLEGSLTEFMQPYFGVDKPLTNTYDSFCTKVAEFLEQSGLEINTPSDCVVEISTIPEFHACILQGESLLKELKQKRTIQNAFAVHQYKGLDNNDTLFVSAYNVLGELLKEFQSQHEPSNIQKDNVSLRDIMSCIDDLFFSLDAPTPEHVNLYNSITSKYEERVDEMFDLVDRIIACKDAKELENLKNEFSDLFYNEFNDIAREVQQEKNIDSFNGN